MKKILLLIFAGISSLAIGQSYTLGSGICENVEQLSLDDGSIFYCPKDNIKINHDEDIDIQIFMSKHPDINKLEFALHVFYSGDSKLIEQANPEITLADGTDMKFNNYVASNGGVIVRWDFTPENNNMEQLKQIREGIIRKISFNSSDGRVTKYVDEDAGKNINQTLNCILGIVPFKGIDIGSSPSTSESPGNHNAQNTNFSLGTGACSNVEQLALDDGTKFYCTKDKIKTTKVNNIEPEIFISKYLNKNELDFSVDLFKWVDGNIVNIDVEPDFEVTFTDGTQMNLKSHEKSGLGVEVYFCKEDHNQAQFKKFKNETIQGIKITVDGSPIYTSLDAETQQAVKDNLNCILGLSPFEGAGNSSKDGSLTIASNEITKPKDSKPKAPEVSTVSNLNENSDGNLSEPDKEYQSLKALGRDMDYLKAVCMDEKGNLLILADYYIYRYNQATGKCVAIAGNLEARTEIDNIPANKAELINVKSIVADKQGNIYIAEDGHPIIRKIDKSTGIISVYAGNRTEGFSGDGGPATNAQFWVPDQLALDAAGNLYIADMRNNRIRKVDASTGIITTVAGIQSDGENTFGSGFGGDGGPATLARLSHPVGVAVDVEGNIFIAEEINKRVRKVDGNTGIITTYAGTGEEGYSGDKGLAINAKLTPDKLAISKAGNLYIGITHDADLLCKVNKATGIITTVAGHVNDTAMGQKGDGGLAIKASVDPASFVIDAQGNIYMAAELDKAVRKINTEGIITRIAGIYENISIGRDVDEGMDYGN